MPVGRGGAQALVEPVDFGRGFGSISPPSYLTPDQAFPYIFDCGWCVVLLKRHSSIVRRPGRTCKHVRAPISHPTISEGVLGHALSPTQQPGAHLLTRVGFIR